LFGKLVWKFSRITNNLKKNVYDVAQQYYLNNKLKFYLKRTADGNAQENANS